MEVKIQKDNRNDRQTDRRGERSGEEFRGVGCSFRNGMSKSSSNGKITVTEESKEEKEEEGEEEEKVER